MWWIIGVVGWLACGVVSYLWARADTRKKRRQQGVTPQWTKGLRNFGLCLLLLGPIFLAFCFTLWLVDRKDEEARW